MNVDEEIICDKCKKTMKVSALVIERRFPEWNPYGQFYGVCPYCNEGSFNNGTVYMSR